MEVRRIVVVEIHRDHDAEEAADFRHGLVAPIHAHSRSTPSYITGITFNGPSSGAIPRTTAGEEKGGVLNCTPEFSAALRSNALTRLRGDKVKRTITICKAVFDSATSR
jgi:hypothetical protein